MKKLLALLLVLAAVCGMAACSGGNGDAKTTGKSPAVTQSGEPAGTGGTDSTAGETEEPVYDATNILTKYEQKDFEGADFNITCANAFNTSIFVRQAPTDDAEPTDRVNIALVLRDEYLKEAYDVNIVYDIRQDDMVLQDSVRNDVYIGDDLYDLVLASMNYACCGILMDGTLMDIGEVPHVDLDNVWWNQNMKEFLTVNGKTFLATGAITTREPTSVSLILFNKTLFGDYQVEEPYQDVFDGNWTYDKMFRIYNGNSVDINHDGIIDIADDQVGFLAGDLGSFYGCGGRLTDVTEDGFAFVANTERNIGIMESVQGWYNEDCRFNSSYAGVTTFADNRAFFLEVAGCDLSLFRDMTDDFGALPFPKYNESQKDYYTITNQWITTCAMFPYTIDPERYDMVGFLTETMCAMSYYTSSPEQYEVIMLNKELRDDESKEILKLCVETATNDMGYIYNFGGGRDLTRNVLLNGLSAKSAFDSVASVFEGDVESFVSKFRN